MKTGFFILIMINSVFVYAGEGFDPNKLGGPAKVRKGRCGGRQRREAPKNQGNNYGSRKIKEAFFNQEIKDSLFEQPKSSLPGRSSLELISLERALANLQSEQAPVIAAGPSVVQEPVGDGAPRRYSLSDIIAEQVQENADDSTHQHE